jgi:predicted PurR-regulated permease PerM
MAFEKGSTSRLVAIACGVALLLGWAISGDFLYHAVIGLDASAFPAGEAIQSLFRGAPNAVGGMVLALGTLLALAIVVFFVVRERVRAAAPLPDEGRRHFLAGSAAGVGAGLGALFAGGFGMASHALLGVGKKGNGWSEIASKIQRYIVVKAVLSAATGLAVGTVLAVLGIDLAMVFGLMAFLLNFIPSIGSIVATLLPLPVVIFNPELGTTTAVLAIALPGLIQLVVGNVVDPLVMGEALDLHPVAIVLSLILWGMIWGVVGMLLAAPIAAILKLLLERLELTAPLGRLLAGRLGPPESES